MKVYGHYNKVLGKFEVSAVDPIVITGRQDEMEVHFRAGTRAPRPGDVLEVWVDVTTPYAMAPKKEVPL